MSFDGGGKSLPGHFHFVSPGQINVQIPWEFQGQSSVKMKVTLYGYLWGDVYTVPLATYSPGIFAVTDGANNRRFRRRQSGQTRRQNRDLRQWTGAGRFAADLRRAGFLHGIGGHQRRAHRDHRRQHGDR